MAIRCAQTRHDQLLYKPPHTGGALAWHQDAPLWPILHPDQSFTMVSAWIPLDSVDADNGALRMVPGSYRWGDRMETLREIGRGGKDTLDDSGFGAIEPPSSSPGGGGGGGAALASQPCVVARGEVHFHHALTWHGSGANLSDRPRRAHAVHYMRADTRYVASRDHVMKQHVLCADGQLMSSAGPHFPRVSDSTGRVLGAIELPTE
jgi:phytanoyl-CoA hydroxylase|eukprot:COSAG06_NODE_1346_length_9780_cov_44.066729_9_plen_206_part_00